MTEEHKKHPEHKTHHKKRIKKIALWQWLSVILGVLLVASVLTGGFGGTTAAKKISAKAAGEKAIEYINTNLMEPGTSATLESVSEKNGLYNIKIDIAGRGYDSYVTFDGNLLFPNSFELNLESASPEVTGSAVADTLKSDKPKVDLFVMSHCPYGTQTEKGILPVVELLGDKIDFNLRFVYYAMHGKTELDEQTLQNCIQEEQNDKFISYLSCFLKEGNTEECLTEIKIDKNKLDKCIETTDKEFRITEQFSDQSTWLNGRYPLFDIDKELNQKYSVRGSPALVINDVQVSSNRDPASLLSTICSSFNKEPSECEKTLSSTTPSPGFGYEGSGVATDASCS